MSGAVAGPDATDNRFGMGDVVLGKEEAERRE